MILRIILALGLAMFGCAPAATAKHRHSPTPTPTATITPTPRPTVTPTATPSPTATPISSTGTSILLTWKSTPGHLYRIFRNTSPSWGSGTDIGAVSSYRITGLTAGKTYYFTLTARNAIGESAKATPVRLN